MILCAAHWSGASLVGVELQALVLQLLDKPAPAAAGMSARPTIAGRMRDPWWHLSSRQILCDRQVPRLLCMYLHYWELDKNCFGLAAGCRWFLSVRHLSLASTVARGGQCVCSISRPRAVFGSGNPRL